MFEELEELEQIALRAQHLDDVLKVVPTTLEPVEYVGAIGDRIGIKVLPNQSPLYKTKEEAEEASKNPDSQVLHQFEIAVVKDYLKLEG